MVNPIFQNSTIPLLEQVAAFTERRQEVLAGNIANINTDDYRMRDLDVEKFEATLKQAVEQRQQSQHPTRSQASLPFPSPGFSYGHPKPNTQDITQLFTKDLFEAVEAKPKNLTFQDGNNRSVEEEIMEMTKNAMLQSYAVQMINAQMNLLQSAISERV